MLSQQSKEALRVLGVDKEVEKKYLPPMLDAFIRHGSIEKLFDPEITSNQVWHIAVQYCLPWPALLKITLRINRQMEVNFRLES